MKLGVEVAEGQGVMVSEGLTVALAVSDGSGVALEEGVRLASMLLVGEKPAVLEGVAGWVFSTCRICVVTPVVPDWMPAWQALMISMSACRMKMPPIL